MASQSRNIQAKRPKLTPLSDREPELSVVIPLYNEASVIAATHSQLKTVLDNLALSYEIVLVNDGSTDESLATVKELSEADANTRIVSLARNFGHEMATTAGVNYSRGRAVIVMDADLQDPPEVIPQMVKKWREGFEVVYAVRNRRRGETWLKRFTSACFYRIFALVSEVKFPTDTGDFRLMDRRVVDVFKSLPENPRFFRGLISWIGFKQTGVSFIRQPRAAGKSKYRYAALFRLAFDTLTAFSTYPAFVIFVVAAVMVAGSFLFTIGLFFASMSQLFTVPAWEWMGSVILDVISIQFLCLSILGQYIVRTHRQTQQRPLYVVDSVIESQAQRHAG
jgi:polyisoprenyl-phosphate glycosyltransferase